MIRITNISASSRAAAVLRREGAKFKGQAGEPFALFYMPFFVNADGTTVEGFEPGYAAGPMNVDRPGDHWVLARLADGTEFCFMPKFKWSLGAHYIIDMAGSAFALFSIRRAGAAKL